MVSVAACPRRRNAGGLIDQQIRGEIYYREAELLGLDMSDSVIQQRLLRKMESLMSSAPVEEPGETTPRAD